MQSFRLVFRRLCRPFPHPGRCWRWLQLLPLALVCWALLPQPVTAHPDDSASLGPFTVNVSLYILDIPKVDEPAETFDIDAYLNLTWKDLSAYELVKNKVSPDGTYHSGSTLEAGETLRNIGWFYIVEFANQAKARDTIAATLKIDREGNIEYLERLQMTLRSVYTLYKYPFDSQQFRIRIESFDYDKSKMAFKVDQIIFYRPIGSEESRLILEDWALPQAPIGKAGFSRSALTHSEWPYVEVWIDTQRKFGYHVWKIFLPLMLIIGISWSVFWIGKEDVSSRLSLSLIGFLTAVSFGFFIGNSLPKISYLTLMDYYIIGTYVFMTLTVIEVLATYALATHGKEAIAARVNLHSRWAYPLGFLLYLAAMVLMV
jgi:hypothetical protein